ncbi:hypothetical protein LLEC1_03157 [Akanthomyces lecanii]|uniref:PWWP domain-containing protein n=1 Tax=Cordyceps confragosa TaxID=2714763 RepID=A0A179I8J2_CORDF|nr:hypothetical protein LLEC1_03157 [Akanthomyces lecanii]
MADTTATIPEVAAPATNEQTATTEPVAAPADTTKTQDVAATEGDVQMNEAAETAPAVVATETPNSKKNNRRKSVGGGLSRKGSKARLTHTDAKPGDHFLMKLKGFPPWPVIICDESMLPPALISTRPVSAAKDDGTYAEAYADGGKRVHDRTFPVMYLFTNELHSGWAGNTTLTELSAEKATNSINSKMRKDLRAAFELAVEQHPIEHYKEVLAKFEEELEAQQKAFEEAEAARMEAAATPKKSKKSKKTEEDDVDKDDVDSAKPKSKKRKAEDEASTPQRSDSVKKPKIKLNTSSTPKANGTPSKKTESVTKPKSDKKAKDPKKVKDSKKAKEAEMTPEEKRDRKQREVFFLRHKLQKGLLSKDTPPVETEMKGMSDFLTALETFTDLEASIIRETKINKVLKAILKMESIPREEEFSFKKRSQGLLDKWNKLLANAAAAAPAGNTNGVNGSEEKKETNGSSEGVTEVKASSEKPDGEQDKMEPSEPAKEEEKAPEAVAAAAE